jgi:prepilin-type N-terminal cleavage/methylation domain-containing protein
VQWHQASDRRDDQNGFTLVEMVAAFAIGSVIILAAAALLHNVALSFDRGTSRVTGGERLAVAADRLATDIASAGFVLQKTPAGVTVAFAGAPARVVFVGFEGADAGPRRNDQQSGGQEVVSLTVEAADDTTQIVRRRGSWPGPRTSIEDVALKDDVVLLKGSFDATFAFARVAPDGGLSWVDTWAGERTLPRLVKLALRDRVSGTDLLGGAEFAIRADAPLPCAAADAGVDCLSGSGSGSQQSPQIAPQQSQGRSP